jgi:predicted RNA-binding Zn-ribbon protein involved in translation (DUF1610 family)
VTSTFREPDHWIVRADYVFLDGQATVGDVDALVEGQLLPGYGLSSHAIGNQPSRTTLEWRVQTIAAARRAVERLESINVIDHVRVSKQRADRMLDQSEFSIRASDGRAGKAVCVACGPRIPATHATLFALEGARPGNEIILRCAACNFPMGWVILDE